MHKPKRNIVIKRNGIDLAWNISFKDGFDLRAKNQALSIPVVIQRLLAETVTGDEKALTFSIPKGKGKHAAQVLDTVIAVLFVGMHYRLGITICAEAMAVPLKFFPQLTVVINFSIEDDKDILI